MLKRLFCSHGYVLEDKTYLYSRDMHWDKRGYDSIFKISDIYLVKLKCIKCGKINYERWTIRSE